MQNQPGPNLPPSNGGSTLSRVVEENIQTILRVRQQEARRRTLRERIADWITDFSGSMAFVYLHILWFVGWVLLNSGWLGFKPFDPFPYSFLTMIVSLEAIFLSTFVLISQNRMRQSDIERAELDLQINLLTERELTRVLQMLDKVQGRLGITNDNDIELADLEQETKPDEVLKEIERTERGKPSKGSSV